MNVDAGYEIYKLGEEHRKFYFERAVGSRGVDTVATKKHESRNELQSFGKMPYVYYSGDMNYREFELSTVFTDLEIGDFIVDGTKNEIEVTSPQTCREQVDEFKELLMERKPLIVTNTQGQYFVCDVQLTNESSPKQHRLRDSLNYIEVTVKCVEIADYFNRIQIKHVGEGRGVSAVSNEFNETIEVGNGGNEVSYFIDVEYGGALKLFAEATEGHFIRWSVNNATITNLQNFTEYHDGMVLEVEFKKKLKITIRHIDDGSGKTEIYQEFEKIGEGSGGLGTYYEIETLGLYPLQLEATPDEGSTFKGWQLLNGGMVYSGFTDFQNGDIIDAIFRKSRAKVVVKHLEHKTDKVLKQEEVYYGQYGLVNFSSADIPDYIPLAPKDQSINVVENGGTYNVVFYYERHHVKILVKHMGSGRGTSTVSQDGAILETGNGGDDVNYTVEINPDMELDLEGVGESIAEMDSEFVGFFYENGDSVGEYDLIKAGTTILAHFNIVVGGDYDWLFMLDWDDTLVHDKSVDLDIYGFLHGGELDGEYVYTHTVNNDPSIGTAMRRVGLDKSNYVELSIDNDRLSIYGATPEVISVLGRPCQILGIRFRVWHGQNFLKQEGLEPISLRVYKREEEFNTLVKTYSTPAIEHSNSLEHQHNGVGYYFCEFNLDTEEFKDVEHHIVSITASGTWD